MSLYEVLHDLFLLDQQVRGLQSRLDGAGKHVRTQQIRIDQINQQLAELNQQLKSAQVAESALEGDVQSIDQRIDKLRQQMNSAKNNKEYSAMLVEINTLKADKTKAEEKALEGLGRIEQIRKKIEEHQGRLAEQLKIKQVADQEYASRLAEVGQQLEDLKARRAVAASRVPPEPLAVFEKLAVNLDGEVMAPVLQEDPRHMDYTCGGCYMSIPMEQVNQLSRSDKLIRCTSCTRILYLGSEVKEHLSNR